jgi:hypothetical protein
MTQHRVPVPSLHPALFLLSLWPRFPGTSWLHFPHPSQPGCPTGARSPGSFNPDHQAPSGLCSDRKKELFWHFPSQESVALMGFLVPASIPAHVVWAGGVHRVPNTLWSEPLSWNGGPVGISVSWQLKYLLGRKDATKNLCRNNNSWPIARPRI